MKKKTDDKGVPRRKNVGSSSAVVPSAKTQTASRTSDPSREERERAKRRELYKKMLRDFTTDKEWCLCDAIHHNGASGFNVNWKRFPELLAQKPKDAGIKAFWWPTGDKAPRIAALKAAIKASAPNKKKV